jgi:hypothetical protein
MEDSQDRTVRLNYVVQAEKKFGPVHILLLRIISQLLSSLKIDGTVGIVGVGDPMDVRLRFVQGLLLRCYCSMT